MEITLSGNRFADNWLFATRRGIPARDLELLYLFDDAGNTANTAWVGSSVLDSSGASRTGTIQASASKVYRESGLLGCGTTTDPSSNGLGISSPLEISGSYTVFVTVRNQHGNGPNLGYQTYYRSTEALDTITNAQSTTPGFSVSEDLETDGETSPRRIRLLCPSQTGGPATDVDETMVVPLAKSTVLTIGISVDSFAGTVTLTAAGASLLVTDADVVSAMLEGSSPKHAFGIMKLTNGNARGTIGCAAVYSRAMSVAEMQTHIAAIASVKGGA